MYQYIANTFLILSYAVLSQYSKIEDLRVGTRNIINELTSVKSNRS